VTPAEKLAARVKQATGMAWDHAVLLAGLAHARFEKFAGVDAKDATALSALGPYDAIQVRLAAWQSNNFGVPTTTQIVCGVVEELAEWEAADEDDAAAAADAVGDTLIYCAQLCTAYRMALSSIVMRAASYRCSDNHTKAAGLLCHVALKGEQRIRGLDDRGLARVGIAAAIASICEALDATDGHGDLFDMYAATAAQVLRRDWRANPVDAAQVADGASEADADPATRGPIGGG
jgi:hypothetical protein